VKAVRPVPGGEHGADRIGQAGDLLDPPGHRLDPLRRQRQPVEERAGELGFLSCGDLDGVIGKDGFGIVADRGRHRGKRLVLLGRRGARQATRSGAGGAADGAHLGADVGASPGLGLDFGKAHGRCPLRQGRPLRARFRTGGLTVQPRWL
jgi:hypothetical protein